MQHFLQHIPSSGGPNSSGYGLSTLIRSWHEIDEKGFAYYMFILFSDVHTNMGDFVTNQAEYLDEMTGENGVIFTMTNLPARWKKYLEENPNPKRTPVRNSKCISNRPQPNCELLKVAKYFNVRAHQMPCIVLFNDINTRDGYIIKLDPNWDQVKLWNKFGRTIDVLNNHTMGKAVQHLTITQILESFGNIAKLSLPSVVSNLFSAFLRNR